MNTDPADTIVVQTTSLSNLSFGFEKLNNKPTLIPEILR
jgi:hypothetical protein